MKLRKSKKGVWVILIGTILLMAIPSCGSENDTGDNGSGDNPQSMIYDCREVDVNTKTSEWIYFDKVVNGYLKPQNVQFNQRSYGHVCKRVEMSVQRSGILYAKLTDCGQNSTAPVNWIKNKVIGGGWPPPAYEQRYLISYYTYSDLKFRPIPDKYKFVVWGDLIIFDWDSVGGNTYTCEAVMLGWTQGRAVSPPPASKGWTMITNSASSKCYRKTDPVFEKLTHSMPLECRHISTGEPKLFKVTRHANRGASPNHFVLSSCNE